MTWYLALDNINVPTNCTFDTWANGVGVSTVAPYRAGPLNTTYTSYVWNFTTTSATYTNTAWEMEATILCTTPGSTVEDYLNYFRLGGVQITPGP